MNDIHPGTGTNVIELNFNPGRNTIFFEAAESQPYYNDIGAFTAGAAANSLDMLNFNKLISNLNPLGLDGTTLKHLDSNPGPGLSITDSLFLWNESASPLTDAIASGSFSLAKNANAIVLLDQGKSPKGSDAVTQFDIAYLTGGETTGSIGIQLIGEVHVLDAGNLIPANFGIS